MKQGMVPDDAGVTSTASTLLAWVGKLWIFRLPKTEPRQQNRELMARQVVRTQRDTRPQRVWSMTLVITILLQTVGRKHGRAIVSQLRRVLLVAVNFPLARQPSSSQDQPAAEILQVRLVR